MNADSRVAWNKHQRTNLIRLMANWIWSGRIGEPPQPTMTPKPPEFTLALPAITDSIQPLTVFKESVMITSYILQFGCKREATA